MSYRNPSICPFGERSILITWKPAVEETLLKFILQVKAKVQQQHPTEVINTYNALLIEYDGFIADIGQEIAALKDLVNSVESIETVGATLYHFPVCYDQKFGWDTTTLGIKNNLRFRDIQLLHAAPVYTIYFTGFLLGFLYLGGMDKRLFAVRKKHPRKMVPKGAVGIAGDQTGIYPKSSPGGWQIIGNCPLELFNVNRNPPAVFKPGDRIKFYAVSLEEHGNILDQVKRHTFSIKKDKYEN